MTSSHRSLERLPSDLFENLIIVDGHETRAEDHVNNEGINSGLLLQQQICTKLKSFPKKIGSGRIKRRIMVKDVGEFLKIPEKSLMYCLDPLLTFAECRELRRRICLFCAAKPTSTLVLLQRAFNSNRKQNVVTTHTTATSIATTPPPPPPPFVSSGIAALDEQLLHGGGFRIGSVTEIVGRAGTGKTQLGIQVCVETAKRGLSAVYIDTEGKFSLPRLQELSSERINNDNNHTHNNDNDGSDFYFENSTASRTDQAQQHRLRMQQQQKQRIHETLSRILLYSATDIDQLRSTLSEVEVEACVRNDPLEQEVIEEGPCLHHHHHHHVVEEPPIAVIVLDSIAAPARRNFGKGEMAAQSQTIMEFANTLKRMAETLRVAVIVINQIGGVAFQQQQQGGSNNKNTDRDSDDTVMRESYGALGNSWHHCATTRLLMEIPLDNPTGRCREIIVTKSSFQKHGGSSRVVLGRKGLE